MRPTGVQRIAIERTRQLEELGYDVAHDQRHTALELAKAAACYGLIARDQLRTGMTSHGQPEPDGWPWPGFWKPSEDPVRNLVKAGALIAASIDRIQMEH